MNRNNRRSGSNTLNKSISIIVLVLAGFFLFMAQSAYWFNHTVFNQQSFTDITTTAIQKESSRDAISKVIINNALKDRPALQRVVGERAQSLISGLLASDLSTQAVNTLASNTYQYVTSSDRQDISINLTGIKQPLSNVLSIYQQDEALDRTSTLPNEITVLRADSFPDLSGFVVAMLWLAPLLWIITGLLFLIYVLLDKQHYAKRIYFAGLTIIAVGVFGYLTSPYVPSPIAASIPAIEVRPLAENVIACYLQPFRAQMLFMILSTALFIVLFNQRYNLVGLFKSFDKIK